MEGNKAGPWTMGLEYPSSSSTHPWGAGGMRAFFLIVNKANRPLELMGVIRHEVVLHPYITIPCDSPGEEAESGLPAIFFPS